MDDTVDAILDMILKQNGCDPRGVDLLYVKWGKDPSKVFHRRLKNGGVLFRSGEQQPSSSVTLRTELGQDWEEGLTNTWNIVGALP